MTTVENEHILLFITPIQLERQDNAELSVVEVKLRAKLSLCLTLTKYHVMKTYPSFN